MFPFRVISLSLFLFSSPSAQRNYCHHHYHHHHLHHLQLPHSSSTSDEVVNTLSAHANPSDKEIKSFVPGVATPLHSANFNKKNTRKVHPKLSEIKNAAQKKPAAASGYSAPMPALIERSSLAIGAHQRASVVSEGEEGGADQFDHSSVQLGPSHG